MKYNQKISTLFVIFAVLSIAGCANGRYNVRAVTISYNDVQVRIER